MHIDIFKIIETCYYWLIPLQDALFHHTLMIHHSLNSFGRNFILDGWSGSPYASEKSSKISYSFLHNDFWTWQARCWFVRNSRQILVQIPLKHIWDICESNIPYRESITFTSCFISCLSNIDFSVICAHLQSMIFGYFFLSIFLMYC